MNLLELCCVGVIVIWAVFRLRGEANRQDVMVRMAAVAVAAFVAEDTCIRLYGFYFYNRDRWTIFVDEVPLLVLCIWPVVITSGLDFLERLRVPPRHWFWAMCALVVADAWFIEPAAVDAGLWHWTQPGPFNVPSIGVLGWGLFSVGVGLTAALRTKAVADGAGFRWPWMSVVVIAPIACHVLLLLTWWGCFRWVPGPLPVPVLLALVWGSSLAVVGVVVRRRPEGLGPLVWRRFPAAIFFFTLLAIYGRDDGDLPLVFWCLAFAPPWMAMWLLARPQREDDEPTP